MRLLAPFAPAPRPVRNVQLREQTHDSLLIAWTAPPTVGDRKVARYRVQWRKLDSHAPPQSAITTSTTYRISGLEGGQYDVRVYAQSSSGADSLSSGVGNAWTAPEPHVTATIPDGYLTKGYLTPGSGNGRVGFSQYPGKFGKVDRQLLSPTANSRHGPLIQLNRDDEYLYLEADIPQSYLNSLRIVIAGTEFHGGWEDTNQYWPGSSLRRYVYRQLHKGVPLQDGVPVQVIFLPDDEDAIMRVSFEEEGLRYHIHDNQYKWYRPADASVNHRIQLCSGGGCDSTSGNWVTVAEEGSEFQFASFNGRAVHYLSGIDPAKDWHVRIGYDSKIYNFSSTTCTTADPIHGWPVYSPSSNNALKGQTPPCGTDSGRAPAGATPRRTRLTKAATCRRIRPPRSSGRQRFIRTTTAPEPVSASVRPGRETTGTGRFPPRRIVEGRRPVLVPADRYPRRHPSVPAAQGH